MSYGPKKGTRPKNLDMLHAMQRGKPRPEVSGEHSGSWKGDQVGYHALHSWIRRKKGKPDHCAHCGKADASKYEWHNISGTYSRNLDDWMPLCVPCHRKITFQNKPNYKPWNTGMRIRTNTGRTHIKPGQHISPETEFKKGLVPHNKYLEPKPCAKCGAMFQPREASRKYCSYKCYWQSLRKAK